MCSQPFPSSHFAALSSLSLSSPNPSRPDSPPISPSPTPEPTWMPPSLFEWAPTTRDSNPQLREAPEQEKPRCEWDFRLCTVITPPPTGGGDASDILGAIEFDPSDQLLATGGISRKIRIYTAATLLQGEDGGYVSAGRGGAAAVVTNHGSACNYYLCTPAKLSSLRWKPGTGSSVIGSGDYDGVVTEYDLHKRVPVFERDEHGGRRVWSVDYSAHAPQLGVSASDDGTAQVWDTRCSGAGGGGGWGTTLRPGEARAAVCSAEFDPAGGPTVGLGCADRKAYVYDLRMAAEPVAVFRGHRRTVTYVRFVGGGRVVTASTDGCLKMWDAADASELKKYEGHANSKSFVGLSVWKNGGLLACGSESNEVCVYDMRWGEPIWAQGFTEEEGGGRGFVSGACWRQRGGDGDEALLVAAGSNGVLQVSVGRRKNLYF